MSICQHWQAIEWENIALREDRLKFRLIYEGQLSASGGPQQKHAIRKVLHKQLAYLWSVNPALKEMKTEARIGARKSAMDELAERFNRCGFRFVPLVNDDYHLICSLDILFLRRDEPGNVILKGGDIDNRIKTLFDALRVPEDGKELGGAVPEDGEDPFFCLLQNDSLITDFNITTDRLLSTPQHEKNVLLVIEVEVKAVRMNFANIELGW